MKTISYPSTSFFLSHLLTIYSMRKSLKAYGEQNMKDRSNIFKAIFIWRLVEDISIKRKALNSRIVSMLEPYNTFSLPGTFYLLCSGSGRAGKGFSKLELLWSSSCTLTTHRPVCLMKKPGTGVSVLLVECCHL